MRGYGSGDHDGVDFGIAENFISAFGGFDERVTLFDQSAPLRYFVRAPLDFDALDLGEVSDQIRTPVA
jgi:hypothetical protein